MSTDDRNQVTPSVTIIVPIFNLSRHRLNNFCFIIKELAQLSLTNITTCKVVVCEQISDKTQYIEQVMLKYPNVRYITSSIDSSSINKSELINKVGFNSSTEYLWSIDADFYTDYQQVLCNLRNKFIRPFSQVVFLNEEESSYLISNKTINLTQNDYKTNNQDGKFSFIVARDSFLSVNGMNTDYMGWGFQDLDFVNNRLPQNTNRGVIDIQGYHLYHARAPKTHVNLNRQLYINYGGVDSQEVYKTDVIYKGNIETNIKKQSFQKHKLKPKPTAVVEELGEPPTIVIPASTTRWSCPTRGIFYFSKTPTFKCLNQNVLKTSDSCRTLLKQTSRGLEKISISRPAMCHYIEYVKNTYSYINDTDTVLFINDYFTTDRHSIKQMNELVERVNEGKWSRPKGARFSWLKETTLGRYKGKSVKYSPAGCFLVEGSSILKNPIDYYEDLFNDMRNWSKSQYVDFLKTLPMIFA